MKKLLLLTIILSFPHQFFAQSFTEISTAAGITFSREQLFIIGGGVCVLDYNNDGWEDIFLPGGYGVCALYKNNGNGTFSNQISTVLTSATYNKLDSLFITSAIVGDIDNDGDKDIFLTTGGLKIHGGVTPKPNVLLENLGNNTFADISVAAGIIFPSYGEAAAMGDYNLDGHLDIYVSNYVKTMSNIYDSLFNQIGYLPECRENFFYINNGNKTFTESGLAFGLNNKGCSLTASFTDYDNDSDVDIMLANDFGGWTSYPNALFENNYPQNTFSNVANSSGFNRQMYGMGIAPGDYDEDGDLDYYITNIGTNSLYTNNGNGTFTDVAMSLGVDVTWAIVDSLRKTSWGCNFLDMDNDTYLDLFVGTGYVEAFLPLTTFLDSNKLYKNDGNGNFVDISVSAGVASPIAVRGSATFDFDHDGDLDIVANHSKLQIYNANGIPQNLLLYRNDNSNGNNWLKIKLSGTTNNKDGYGSRIKIFAGNRSFIREIDGGSSHASINSPIAHFGLGVITMVDSVKVYWLGGEVQTVYNVASNQVLTIVEPNPNSITKIAKTISDVKIYPTITNSLSNINIEFNSKISQDLEISIVNVLGAIVFQQEINISAGKNSIQLSDFIENQDNSSQFLFIKIDNKKQTPFTSKICIIR